MQDVNHPEMEKLEAAAFRRLMEHLRVREDASNIDLMGLAGFCRNCLADWLAEASIETDHPLTVEEGRTHIYGERYVDFKSRQPQATPEQLARMKASVALNDELKRTESHQLDRELAQSFPASDPPKMVSPRS